MVNVVEGMAPMGEEMILNGMTDEVEMWRETVIDGGEMIDSGTTLMNTETVQM